MVAPAFYFNVGGFSTEPLRSVDAPVHEANEPSNESAKDFHLPSSILDLSPTAALPKPVLSPLLQIIPPPGGLRFDLRVADGIQRPLGGPGIIG